MSNTKPNETEKLKRTLNFPLLIFYGVGTILGLGIYVLLGKGSIGCFPGIFYIYWLPGYGECG
ncbi:MAG: hypothetical protein WD431_04305 [Cyclobacteriaceae bacterium]